MLPSELFPVGARVRYIGDEMPDERGRLGTVLQAPRLHNDGSYARWIGMRIIFDGDRLKDSVMAWPEQYEPVSIVERLAELDRG